MNAIVVSYLEDVQKSDQFQLIEDIEFDVLYYGKITVPKGYITDFASSPQLLWPLFPPIGKFNRATVIHDFLYENRILNFQLSNKQARLIADVIFLNEANKANPNGYIRHLFMFFAIRLFGKSHWLTDSTK